MIPESLICVCAKLLMLPDSWVALTLGTANVAEQAVD